MEIDARSTFYLTAPCPYADFVTGTSFHRENLWKPSRQTSTITMTGCQALQNGIGTPGFLLMPLMANLHLTNTISSYAGKNLPHTL